MAPEIIEINDAMCRVISQMQYVYWNRNQKALIIKSDFFLGDNLYHRYESSYENKNLFYLVQSFSARN